MDSTPRPGIDPREKYVALTTYRDSGAMVTTPVWFVDGPFELRVITDANSGKVRRILSEPRVTLSACDMRGRVTGPTLHGTAVVEDDESQLAALRDALHRKYGLAAKGFTRLAEALGREPERVQLRIELDA